jgi:uncharacterized damage-inducible protein DinB
MTTTLLGDAFAHHVWATERLIRACAALTPEQMAAPVPGTFGSIIDTLRHLVAADSWYLSFFDGGTPQLDETADTSLNELMSMMLRNGSAWTGLLAGDLDPDADVPEHGDEGWEFHAPAAFRLAQVVHHGTDHRSQVCTALSSLGLTPPEIDLWAFGEAVGRTRAVPAPAPPKV